MEIIAAIAVFAAIVAFAHAGDVRARNRELFAHCVELARANGALMVERNALLQDAQRKEAA